MRRAALAVAALALLVVLALLARSLRGRPEARGGAADAGSATAPASAPASAAASASAPAAPSASASTAAPSPTDLLTAGRARPWPSPPDHYTLTPLDRAVAVNLAGGPATITTVPLADEAERTRTLRGRVVAEGGGPIAGAIVLASPRLSIQAGQITADAGAMTATDGSFQLAAPPATPLRVLALAPSAWSPVVAVAADAPDAPLELHIGAPARLEGTVLVDGAPGAAELTLTLDGATDVVVTAAIPDGAIHLVPLPPGRWTANARRPRTDDGPAASVTATLSIAAGQTTRHDFDVSFTVPAALAPPAPAPAPPPASRP
jgi:hypothetical protein